MNEDEVNAALTSLQLEDPRYNTELTWRNELLYNPLFSVRVVTNKETGQTIISGMGELHMEIVKDRILNHYKAKAIFGDLYIAYRYDNNHSFTAEYDCGSSME